MKNAYAKDKSKKQTIVNNTVYDQKNSRMTVKSFVKSDQKSNQYRNLTQERESKGSEFIDAIPTNSMSTKDKGGIAIPTLNLKKVMMSDQKNDLKGLEEQKLKNELAQANKSSIILSQPTDKDLDVKQAFLT